MGNCMAMDEETKRDRELNRELKKDFKLSANVAKLLLLGTGESGKSTIVKQMKIIHGTQDSEKEGLTEEERTAQVVTIKNNILDSIEALLTAAEEFGYKYSESEAQEAKTRVSAALESSERANQYTPQLAKDVKLLWNHATTAECVKRTNEFQFLDSAPYFLNQTEKFASPEYIPSDEDVLRARSMTTGIVTVPFEVKAKGSSSPFKFELVDVGGQRTERRKWIHCFQEVTAVMFIISLSDYNQTLYEDETTNRMQESEKLFGEMLNNVFFRETPFIVFFNKVDLFKEKLKTASLAIAYKEYTGSQDYEEALTYIRFRFLNQNKNERREIYPYETTATDTNLVKNLFNTIKEIIMAKILQQTGFQ
eukprot:TRINITY_DN22928_c0_g1_i1.p1 TRINITY_DN22928_c0_g1~~TRINITY_DN22928_c0_g1_i1.p1  ORF type:complete len:365 (-),score=104.15 TRINITY_DN22928_c0_g1_i1:269-1363(-)